MHDERAAAGGGDRVDEGDRVGLGVLVVDADAALDRDRHGDAPAHRRDAVGDERGLAIRQAPKRPSCTRSDGQPTLRLISA